MPRIDVRRLLLIQLCLAIIYTTSGAQNFLILSDADQIGLALDKLRKGIQQADTTKIMKAMGSVVTIDGKANRSRDILAVELQTIFEKAEGRELQLTAPEFIKENKLFRESVFWDFDILDPKITILGDSAIVECELVLWGAPVEGKTNAPGLKVGERLVFKAIKRDEKLPLPDGAHEWPGNIEKQGNSQYNRVWRLIGFKRLWQFLQCREAKTKITTEH